MTHPHYFTKYHVILCQISRNTFLAFFLKYANFSPDILQNIENGIGLHLQDIEDEERKENGFLAIDLIDYIYAVLHSVTYRDTYHDFLQNDFPTSMCLRLPTWRGYLVIV